MRRRLFAVACMIVPGLCVASAACIIFYLSTLHAKEAEKFHELAWKSTASAFYGPEHQAYYEYQEQGFYRGVATVLSYLSVCIVVLGVFRFVRVQKAHRQRGGVCIQC